MLKDLKTKLLLSLNKKQEIKEITESHNYIKWKERKETIVEKLKKTLSNRVIIKKNTKKFKLIVIGDSLVCGVGCDSSNNDKLSSPVLPQMLAKVLSVAMVRLFSTYSILHLCIIALIIFSYLYSLSSFLL